MLYYYKENASYCQVKSHCLENIKDKPSIINSRGNAGGWFTLLLERLCKKLICIKSSITEMVNGI